MQYLFMCYRNCARWIWRFNNVSVRFYERFLSFRALRIVGIMHQSPSFFLRRIGFGYFLLGEKRREVILNQSCSVALIPNQSLFDTQVAASLNWQW